MIFASCCCIRIFNKEGATFQLSRVTIIVTTLLATASLFGRTLLIKIPAEYGGEKRNSNTYYLDSASIKKIEKTNLKSYIKKDNTIIINPVYETSEKLYFQTSKNEVSVLPKSYINIEEIKIP